MAAGPLLFFDFRGMVTSSTDFLVSSLPTTEARQFALKNTLGATQGCNFRLKHELAQTSTPVILQNSAMKFSLRVQRIRVEERCQPTEDSAASFTESSHRLDALSPLDQSPNNKAAGRNQSFK